MSLFEFSNTRTLYAYYESGISVSATPVLPLIHDQPPLTAPDLQF